jgi:hypothetical protein
VAQHRIGKPALEDETVAFELHELLGGQKDQWTWSARGGGD